MSSDRILTTIINYNLHNHLLDIHIFVLQKVPGFFSSNIDHLASIAAPAGDDQRSPCWFSSGSDGMVDGMGDGNGGWNG